MHSPSISIITATLNRGQHLIPTLTSALRQSHQNFEIIVVGDGCTDDTEQVLQPYISERVRWHNLPKNSGSQSAPNNKGLELAKGHYIAFLGHDDIWSPDHLDLLMKTFEAGADIAVSGCVFHGPPGGNFHTVTGLFSASKEVETHFFPPSSFALTRRAAERIGKWQMPESVRAPVDADYCLRGISEGLNFRSTGQITVHKFAAGHRYLSYLKQSSDEQEEMLSFLQHGNTPQWREGLISSAKAAKRFMIMTLPDFSKNEPGELFHRNAENRGLRLPGLMELVSEKMIAQDDGPRAIDWAPLAPGTKFRWSLHNPRPKILIPYSSTKPVNFSVDIHGMSQEARSALAVQVNGERVAHSLSFTDRGVMELAFAAKLLPDKHSIVELNAPLGAVQNGWIRGIAVGDIRLSPQV
ncbi:MAG: glycosyltransferase [Proteobacteria bacterium]|nr:glycosyltransferase [Pseudomonadota bacterium]